MESRKKFYCLRQVQLAENLPQATHTLNRVKKYINTPKKMLYIPWMIILSGDNIKKTSFENFDF